MSSIFFYVYWDDKMGNTVISQHGKYRYVKKLCIMREKIDEHNTNTANIYKLKWLRINLHLNVNKKVDSYNEMRVMAFYKLSRWFW